MVIVRTNLLPVVAAIFTGLETDSGREKGKRKVLWFSFCINRTGPRPFGQAVLSRAPLSEDGRPIDIC